MALGLPYIRVLDANSNPVVLNSLSLRICKQEFLVKKFLLAVLSLSTLYTAPTLAAMTDAVFVNKFATYKAKHKVTTYRAAKVWSAHLKQSPEKVLQRYISTRFNQAKNSDAIVVEAVDAFKESGLSYDKSLAAVSDIVGQLPETLNTIYTRATGAKARGGLAAN